MELHDAVAGQGVEPASILVGAVTVTLLERVAEGRFADVWRGAMDGRPVAVKLATSDLGARMVRAEVTLGARVKRAPRVVPIVAFQDGDRPRLVMPWIGEGRTLRDALRAARSEDDRAQLVRLITDVAETLGRVHEWGGVVHGDLKPENVLLDGEGRPWLTDFGLSREVWQVRLQGSLSASLRTEGEVTGGTLAYLPPEAVKGAEPSRSGDVYALGVMLHEALLGRFPDKVVSPDDVRRLLPDCAAVILLRALAFAPGDRQPDAWALRRELLVALPTLGATGLRRRHLAARRFVIAGLAAFFVALRYTSVVALVGIYASIAVLALWKQNPALLLIYVPFALLHGTIRWEGPETPQELAARRGGYVVDR